MFFNRLIACLLITYATIVTGQQPHSGAPQRDNHTRQRQQDYQRYQNILVATNHDAMTLFTPPLRILERNNIHYATPRSPVQQENTTNDELPSLTLLSHFVRNPEQITGVTRTPINGLFQITIGNDLFYISQNGRYLIQGDILDLENSLNLTEINRNKRRAKLLAQIPNSDFITYPANNPTKYRVTVFSDIDCTYCRILHSNLAHYNALGIEIRYIAFPRTGVNSVGYQKLVSVWCAKDRKSAFTRASTGLDITMNLCDSSVPRDYQLGLNIGINGTPSFILEDGTLIAGYVTPENLLRILQNKPK